MDELIYRDALIEKMGERAKKYSKIDECTELTIYEDMHIVNNAPAVDAVEVVRCKDCKHYMTIHCTCDGCCISDYWYCADGERRADDGK